MNEKTLRIRLDEIGSTNDYAKALRGEGKNVLITAKKQTGGRGTKGRSFSSEEGGVYLSKLTFYENFPAKAAFEVMIGAAVAVCETLKGYGLQPVVKWPNDILVGGKKICGILIENTFSGGFVSSSVVGIGLNVCNPLEGLSEIATSTARQGKNLSVDEVTETLISALEKSWTIVDYRKYLGYTGQKVELVFGDERVPATLLFVEDDGTLVVEIDGKRRSVSFGEVTVRV